MGYKSSKTFDKEKWLSEVEEKKENVINGVLSIFQSGDMPEVIAKKLIRSIGKGKPSDNYSVTNFCIMIFNGTEDCRGYHDWLKVGRCVMKGAKSFFILAPVFKKDNNGDSKFIGSKAVPVFPIENTEVVDQIKWDNHLVDLHRKYTPPVLPPLFDVAQKLGLKVNYQGVKQGKSTGAWGWYSPSTQEIRLYTDNTSVFFHELAHHVDGLINVKLKGGQHDDQEIVAELTAASLCHMFSTQFPDLLGNLAESKKYIEGYGFAPTGKNVQALIERVGKIIKFILHELELDNIEEVENEDGG